jgi:hypothetical protein
MLDTSTVLRTAIYIDGYNLYYGRLRGTQYKWLDVVALFSRITRSVEPHSQIIYVKFFTAPALPKFSRHGEKSMRAQNDYHRALEAKYPSTFKKVLGSHAYEKDGTKMPVYIEGSSFDIETITKLDTILKDRKVDILFIDGDHSYDGVKKDFDLYNKYVKEGGYIVFDDYNDTIHSPEVKPSVDNLELLGYDILGEFGNEFGARPEKHKPNEFVIRKK